MNSKLYYIRYLRSSLIVYSLSLFLTSCNTFDPPEVIPCYGHIDKIPLTTNYKTQGTDSAAINTAWVYLDDNPVGAYQMPCTFPIIASAGVHTISIYPGIMQDGIADMRAQYSFFCNIYDTTLTLTQGSTYTFKPKTTYNSRVIFKNMEDFEENLSPPPALTTPSLIFNGPGTDTTMYITRNSADVYQGKGSGIVIVNSAYPAYVGKTDTISFPSNSSGDAVYLEMNYKSTNIFTVGIYAGTDPSLQVTLTPYPIVYVNPTSTWKKMYVNLASTVNQGLNGPLVVYFALNRNPSHSQDTLLLDNIKVLF